MAKGKGKKDPTKDMTPEQKQAYLQQKALEEEQAKVQAAQVAMQFLKDKLQKEEKSVKLNETKLITKWRDILRTAKSEELKKEIQILSQTFERMVDKKNAVIEALVNDLDQAESQQRLAARQHNQNLERFIDLHKLRLLVLQEEYTKDIDYLHDEFGAEKAHIVENHQEEMKRLQDILFAMEHTFQERSQEARQEFHSARDEIKNRENEEVTKLRMDLETSMDSLYNQFHQALRQYSSDTHDRRQEFDNLKAKDEASSKEIDMQMKKIQRIQDTIGKLKDQMANNAKEAEYQNKTLKQEVEQMQLSYRQKKARMNNCRDKEKERLTKVTLLSNAAIKKLTSVKETAEKMLRSAEMCRRMETEEEKVLPFYASSLTVGEQEELQAAAEKELQESNLTKIAIDYAAMENFWKRYNKVLLDKLALRKEQQTLESENSHLRQILKQYLDGVSVNEETLSDRNPLFVVNHRTNVNLGEERRGEKGPVNKTVVEAAHIVKHCL